jgi:hypothetical protein
MAFPRVSGERQGSIPPPTYLTANHAAGVTHAHKHPAPGRAAARVEAPMACAVQHAALTDTARPAGLRRSELVSLQTRSSWLRLGSWGFGNLERWVQSWRLLWTDRFAGAASPWWPWVRFSGPSSGPCSAWLWGTPRPAPGGGTCRRGASCQCTEQPATSLPGRGFRGSQRWQPVLRHPAGRVGRPTRQAGFQGAQASGSRPQQARQGQARQRQEQVAAPTAAGPQPSLLVDDGGVVGTAVGVHPADDHPSAACRCARACWYRRSARV